MHIRPTTFDDWPALKAIRLASLLDAPEAFSLSHAEAAAFDDAQWQARAAGETPPRYFLAWDGPRPIGLAGGVAVDDGHELISMWIEPAARGGGAGRALVAAVAERAAALGAGRLVLGVLPANARACGFYARQGFVACDQAEPFRNGSCRMFLALPPRS
ncbi:GNAT family N-acetyltransferase [Chitinimonas koreensis]|uniref:GNAT family N-acetyltransferase n=1 Tax=Chitinimonas koreensis TaxID=356302 RepID=UPI000410F209|nr:GNAT family N-acetyltransferase [Chitinimonas koreensis]QNM97435.1 GNAT family N-acetyltransferase [Chitinimonas koreensis]